MGLMQRRKGGAGQSEFKKMLKDRGYVFDSISCGVKAEDLIVEIPGNGRYSCEVKNHSVIDIKRFLKQAKEQARERKLPWMLAVRMPEHKSVWIVMWQGRHPALWRGIE